MSRCSRCGWKSQGISQGFIRGLCSECSEEIRKAALRRGIYLLTPAGHEPPPSQRERMISGIHLWWWKGAWRVA